MTIRLAVMLVGAAAVLFASGATADDSSKKPKVALFPNAYTLSDGSSGDLQLFFKANASGEPEARLRAVVDGKVKLVGQCKLTCVGSTCFKDSTCAPGEVPVGPSVLMTLPKDLAFKIKGNSVEMVEDAMAISNLKAEASKLSQAIANE